VGVPRYGVWGLEENEGSGGNHGMWWNTQGLVENAASGGKLGV